MHDGLQPGLKCVAIEIKGQKPFPYIASSYSELPLLSRSILKSPVKYTLDKGSLWSNELSSEENNLTSPVGGLYTTPISIGLSTLLM